MIPCNTDHCVCYRQCEAERIAVTADADCKRGVLCFFNRDTHVSVVFSRGVPESTVDMKRTNVPGLSGGWSHDTYQSREYWKKVVYGV